MFQIQGLEWPLYLMSGFSAFPDANAMIEEGDRNFGVDKNVAKRGKTNNWTSLGRSHLRAFTCFYHFSWNDLDNLKVQFWSSWSPWYPTQCAEGHDTRIQFWIHLTDPGSLVSFTCSIWYADPKDFGLARWKSWASLRHHRTLSITAMSTCEHSGDDTTDTTDTMGEMKRNDAPNNFSVFSITLLDFCLNFSNEKTIAALHGVSLLGAEGCHQRLLLAGLL